MALRRHHRAALFLAACLALLLAPGVGDVRWAGLVGFIYIGLPWYVLALRDEVRERNRLASPHGAARRTRSPTLVVFGLVAAAIGVAIDLFVGYQFLTDASPASAATLALRLLVGVPFFAFGAALVLVGLGGDDGAS